MSDNKIEAVVDGILYRGQITILAGGPGVGKSRYQLTICGRLANESNLKILFCSERQWAFNEHQLNELGITVPSNWRFFCCGDIPKNLRPAFRLNPLKFISDNVLNTFHPDIVVLDTLMGFYHHDGKKVDVNDYITNKMQLEDIADWARNNNFAVWATHHASKQKRNQEHESVWDMILGSQAIAASVVTGQMLRRDPPDGDGEFVVLHQMSHLLRVTPQLRYCTKDYTEVPLEVPIHIQPPSKEEQRILEHLPADKMIPQKEFVRLLAIQLGRAEANVRKSITNLVLKGYVEKVEDEETGEVLIRRILVN